MQACDGSNDGPAPTSYWFLHRLGAIVTACVDAGLAIERLDEDPHSNREAEYDIYEGRQAQIPMSFTMVARKAGTGAG